MESIKANEDFHFTPQEPSVTCASQLPERSSWRKYLEGVKELELWEAPTSVVQDFKYQAARCCFLAFANLMLNNKLRVSEFHEIIASAFEDLVNKKYVRLIVSCPPRSGKSMFSSLFIAWLLGIEGRSNHIVAAYGQKLSSKFYKDIRSHLKNPAFKKVFPDWKGFEPNSNDLAGGGTILSTSVGGPCTGFSGGTADKDSEGLGVCLVDDPLKSSRSRAAIEEVRDWWMEELSTRRTNQWGQVIIGTRFDQNDLHGVVMDTDGLYDAEDNPLGWRWLNIQGIIDTEEQAQEDVLERKIGETHWPDNPTFYPHMIESQRQTMGQSKFYALYMGTPTAKEGQIIRASWIQTIPPRDCPKLDIVWFGLDCALSEEESAAESAICVAGFTHRDPKTIYVIDLVKGKWGFPDLLATVKELQALYNPRVLCIEKAASGHSLIQVLKRESKIAIEEMKPIKSKTARLEAVSFLLEANRVKFVEGLWTPEFIKEVTTFPFCANKDSTDAFAWTLTHYILKLDSSGRPLQEIISQSERWMKNTNRNMPQDGLSLAEPSRGHRAVRRLGRVLANDLDYNLGEYGSGSGRLNRRSTGYNLDL